MPVERALASQRLVSRIPSAAACFSRAAREIHAEIVLQNNPGLAPQTLLDYPLSYGTIFAVWI